MQVIQILPFYTGISPTCLGAFASWVTAMGGNAVKMAAENLRQEILQEAGRLMETSPEGGECRTFRQRRG
jgi:CO/xanthine dehydrogenase Mo-binding subunit